MKQIKQMKNIDILNWYVKVVYMHGILMKDVYKGWFKIITLMRRVQD